MDILENFVDALTDIMQMKNISVKQLIEESGVPKSNIFAYIGKYYLPTTPNVIKLADYFNCSIDYLAGLIDKPAYVKGMKQESTFNKITEISKKYYKTNKEFLNDLNISKSAYYKWKNKNVLPSFETLVNLAIKFDVSIDYLLCRSDN